MINLEFIKAHELAIAERRPFTYITYTVYGEIEFHRTFNLPGNFGFASSETAYGRTVSYPFAIKVY